MIRLVSLNVERSKHLDEIVAFLRTNTPDVVCLQEVCERDLLRFSTALEGYDQVYVPMTNETDGEDTAIVGVGIFSRYKIQHSEVFYYRKETDELPKINSQDAATFTLKHHLVVFADIAFGTGFRIGTTHFTWSQGGKATALQRNDMHQLLAILKKTGEFVLGGDFNAPRGGEIFSMLAEKYKDNIPTKYGTSIDANLHRAGKLHPEELANKMVDGLFSTPGYTVSDVELHSGVSDHMAITATITNLVANK